MFIASMVPRYKAAIHPVTRAMAPEQPFATLEENIGSTKPSSNQRYPTVLSPN